MGISTRAAMLPPPSAGPGLSYLPSSPGAGYWKETLTTAILPIYIANAEGRGESLEIISSVKGFLGRLPRPSCVERASTP